MGSLLGWDHLIPLLALKVSPKHPRALWEHCRLQAELGEYFS